MKVIKLISIVLAAGIFTCCSTNRDYLIGADQNPEADFSEYNTFNWASDESVLAPANTLDDPSLYYNIQDAIEFELNAKGYEHKENNPDMIVAYRVFEEPVQYRGYTDTYNQIDDDVKQDAVIPDGEPRVYNLEKGSLIIELIDRESGEVLWTGYASGIIREGQFDKEEASVNRAVSGIFERFNAASDNLSG